MFLNCLTNIYLNCNYIRLSENQNLEIIIVLTLCSKYSFLLRTRYLNFGLPNYVICTTLFPQHLDLFSDT